MLQPMYKLYGMIGHTNILSYDSIIFTHLNVSCRSPKAIVCYVVLHLTIVAFAEFLVGSKYQNQSINDIKYCPFQ